MSSSLGIIAGNGPYPLLLASEARARGLRVVAVCHKGETDTSIEEIADSVVWIKVGELGKLISTFADNSVEQVALAGGINRIRLFGGVKLDARGAMLLARLRSGKDDVIMRGVAEEIEKIGIPVVSCTTFMREQLAATGVLTKSKPSQEEYQDIKVGISAIAAMSGQDIGQTVVVREGVVVAVEAVEGTDKAILRGGELGKGGSVVVKFAKPNQDMRFDVPTVGVKTIEIMKQAGCRVLALEEGRCLMLEREKMLKLANKYKISIVGCQALV